MNIPSNLNTSMPDLDASCAVVAASCSASAAA